jgi:DNA processing protein
MSRATACDDCLRRTDLVAALAGRIEVAWRDAGAPRRLLARPDDALLDLDPSGLAARRYARFDAPAARRRAADDGLEAVCLCAPEYPARMRDLEDPPAVLHVGGERRAIDAGEAVAVVGARRASPYGLEVAARLGRELSAARVPVISGMALGVDSAAHAGALQGRGVTVAVLAGGADVPYPASKRRLHAEILRRGAVVSELPPGFRAHRWCFVARNRLIAALATVVVIVEATAHSGSLITAGFATDLGRTVGAVPGQVTSRLALGTNALLADGAPVVREAADVLDHLPGTGQTARAELRRSTRASSLSPALGELLAAIEAGHGTLGELAAGGRDPRAVLRGLTELEVSGYVRRGFGGRYVRAA